MVDKYAVSFLGGWVAGLLFMLGCYEKSFVIISVGLVMAVSVAAVSASWSVSEE